MALKAATFLPLSALLWPVVSAHAGVTYSGYQNIAVPQDFNGLYLNVTTGATAFSQPADWNSSSWINPIFGGVHAGSSDLLRPVITGSDQILNLGTGTLISSASTFATGESGSTTHVGAEAGQFTLGTVGTMGFQFETAPGGTTQYGWLNITISNTGAGVIRDWGYEAVAGSIVVGRMEQSAPSGGAQTMTLSPGAGESFTLSSVVSDTGGNTNSLLKTGTGTATLSGANTYTGGTTISAGTLSIGSGSTTGSITGDVTNNSTLAFNRSDELSYAGVVSGTGAVTKSGAGTLTLSGANTYTGGTTISAGTLSIGGGSTTGSITGDVTNNSTLAFNRSDALSYAGVVSGTGAVTKSGAGTLTLSGSNTYSGGTTISGGTLTAGHVNAFGTGALTIGANTFLDLANYNITNTVTNNGGTILNAGTLAGGDFSGGTTDLSGANSTVAAVTGTATVNVTGTNTAITTVSGGTVNVNAAGTTIQSYNGGDVAVGAGLAVTVNEGTSSGTISGAGGLTKAGTGTLVLSGSNSFSGALTVSGGIVSLSTNAAVAGTSGVNLGAGTGLTYTGAAATIDRDITVTGGTGTISNTGGGTLELSGNLSKNGTVLTFAGGSFSITGGISGAGANSDLVVDGAVVALNSTNTYNGPTYLRNAAVLSANVVGAMPTTIRSAVIMDDTGTGSSVLQLAASQQIASLTGAASSGVSLATGTSLTMGTSTGTTTFDGVISGSGGLSKDGASTQTLSGANSYTGGTTISAGTLELSGASGALTATSAVNINGGTLLLSGSAADRISNAASLSLGAATDSILRLSGAVTETLGALTLTSGAGIRVIDFGSTSGVLTLASLSADSHLPVQIWNWSGTKHTGGGTDRLIISSGLLGGSLDVSDFSFFSDSGTTLLAGPAVFNSSGELVPIPEANTLLGVLGLMAPLAWRERRHWMRCRAACA